MRPARLATWLALPVLGLRGGQDAHVVPPPAQSERVAAVETEVTREAARRALGEIDRARSLVAAKDLAQAREVLRAALEALLATPGLGASGEIADALNALGSAATAANDPETLVRAYEPCLAHRIATLGADHIDVQVLRAALGTSYWSLGDFARSEELLAQALDCAKRTLPEGDPRIADAKSNYAVTLYRLARFEEARALMAETLAELVARHGESNPEIQWAVANLANILDRLGDFEGALAMRERVYAILREHRPPDHPDLVVASENLALALRKAGDPVASRFLLQQVLETKQRTLPEGHLGTERTRLNLASALCNLGDWHSARILAEGVVERLSKRLPEGDPTLMNAQSHLAFVLSGLNEDRAAAAIDAALLETCRRKFGEEHRLTAEAMVALAADHHELGEYEEAVRLGEAAVARLRAVGPDDAFSLLAAESRLGASLGRLGRTDEAVALLAGAAERWMRRLGADHPSVWRARTSLAGLLEDRDREGSLAILRDVGRSLIARLSTPSAVSSPRETELAAIELEPLIDVVLARCAELTDAALDFELVEAARQFAASGARSAGGVERACAADPKVRDLRDALRRTSARVAELAHEGSREAYQAAVLERTGLEQALLTAVRPFGGAVAGDVSPGAVAARLPEGSAAVSYRRYEIEAPAAAGTSAPRRTAHFVAFVLKRDGAVARVDLGPAAAIESSIEAWRAAIAGEAANAEGARAAGEAVRKAVLDPVLAAAGEVRRLVAVPDDALLTIPLDALAYGGGIVGDAIAIEVRTGLYELVERRDAPAGAERLLAIGGVEFDTRSAVREAQATAGEAQVAVAPQPKAKSARVSQRMTPRTARFAPLPASAAEIEGIAALYRARTGRDDSIVALRGELATPEALAAAAPRARFLHVATHGFFAPDSVASLEPAGGSDDFAREVQGLSPRVLCGLALAGANAPEDPLDRNSGILTAEELAYLDLGGCELAVLSACDTSTGVRRAGQGLASLRSALHAAGAHSTLTSLWKVPDAATSELMLAFYRGLWVDGLDAGTALWRAKSELRKRRAPLRDWAGWVLSGDPD